MDLKKYKHIIWDWNGTLIDDARLCAEIINILLARRNKGTITLQQYRQKYELPVENLYKTIGFEKDHIGKITAEFIQIYQKRQFECNLQDGATQALQSFRQQGIPQSLLSAYQKKRLLNALTFHRLKPYFKNIAGRDDDYAIGKISIAQTLMQNINSQANQVMLIGDTTHDFHVAQTLGTDCLLVSAGHNTADKLQAHNAPVINSLKGLFTSN